MSLMHKANAALGIRKLFQFPGKNYSTSTQVVKQKYFAFIVMKELQMEHMYDGAAENKNLLGRW